ncbi:MAG: gamma-glutamyltransferase [Phenylobacterium sp.]|jgi:gamma-glutamyltranspeptidase/glutathione hydrolase|uniref:gamma-glutamyltransferase family protein n=1 Tax=Phenylobacterium sp. TaxID=1871053 RepID=UPI00261DBC0E|nr:gamma-glutamyltransferase family protein [Phenylobacterium sp.]MDB5433965.1 gamma-glutamyltransferase [Phenylobacterium sp.]MDB5499701.1 gamma-glutamyltransferase [Phenylobacterium sp.]
MRRRTFLAAVPAAALSGRAFATSRQENPNRDRPDVHGGDRIDGATWASRSPAWGLHGAAATAHPLATQAAIEILKAGGSAVDAAVCANAILGFGEPISCGVGGDCFVMLWDPKARKVVGLNGSGRSPKGLSLAEQRKRANAKGVINLHGAVSVSVPGAVDAWWSLHQRYGKLPWKDLFQPAIRYAEEGAPIVQNVAFYVGSSQRIFNKPDAGIEEVANFNGLWVKDGKTPREGDIFRNPQLARTYRLIAEGGGRAFYEGEIADAIERYFKRIGGWMTKADLAAHHSEWVEPRTINYRGVDVWGLPPNSQGLVTLQILNMMEQFDFKQMGFQSAAAIHHSVEAKRLAFEDRARFYADPAYYKQPTDWLLSKDYARERAKLIRPDKILETVFPGNAPSHGDTTYFTVADKDGMMISQIQSNYSGMGSGLMPDGLGFMFQNRGQLFSLADGHPNVYAPGKRPFQTIIPGFATKGGEPLLSFGVMGGDMQPQGQAQVISNLIDFELGLQEAGDAPRWHHDGGREPTGEDLGPIGKLNLETGVPQAAQKALAALGWPLEPSPGGYGGYEAIQRWPGRYAAATEMRKDGVALAY